MTPNTLLCHKVRPCSTVLRRPCFGTGVFSNVCGVSSWQRTPPSEVLPSHERSSVWGLLSIGLPPKVPGRETSPSGLVSVGGREMSFSFSGTFTVARAGSTVGCGWRDVGTAGAGGKPEPDVGWCRKASQYFLLLLILLPHGHHLNHWCHSSAKQKYRTIIRTEEELKPFLKERGTVQIKSEIVVTVCLYSCVVTYRSMMTEPGGPSLGGKFYC